MAQQQIMVKAILVKDEIMPLWDKRVLFVNDEYFTSHYEYKSGYEKFQSVDVLLDINSKKLSLGILLEIKESDDFYKIGQEVLFKDQHGQELTRTKIKSVVFERFDTQITIGNKMENYHIEKFKDNGIEVTVNDLYCIKTWKPKYVMESGQSTEYPSLYLFKEVK